MSHVVSVDVEVKDRAALEAAAGRCGLVAVDTPEWDWFGRWQNDYSRADAAYRNGVKVEDYGRCEFALVQANSPLGVAELAARAAGRRLTAAEAEGVRRQHHGPNWRHQASRPYSIGVVKNPAGEGFKLVYDFWQGGFGLRDKVGDDAVRLKQAYGLHAAKNVAVKLGHRVVAEATLPDGSFRLDVEIAPRKIKVG